MEGAGPDYRNRPPHELLGLHLITGRSFQGLPSTGRQILGEALEVGRRLVAEDELHARVGGPAVEVRGLGEVGVAAEQHAAEAAPEADGQGPVYLGGGALVRGPVARTVHQA